MANTDKLRLVGKPGTATTLSAPGHTSGGTSITVGSTTNWPTTTGVTFAIDRVTVSGSTETQVAGTYTLWVGDVTGATTIANMTLHPDSPNSDQNYSAGSTTRVYIPVSTATHNDLVTALLVSHDQDGTLKAGAVDNTAVLADDVVTRAKINDADQIGVAGSYAPQGYMVNGKIVTSVATNNLTVAIKTLAGTDPSATDPVHVRIGNTVRIITSALSITRNAGTNWFNSGAAVLAAQEVDYFAYLGWNTSASAVVIGFSRISSARTYGDFSATTTNEKHGAVSNITGIASTDEFEVIGRFNATLSASASFNWSIPATSVIINRPIHETRLLTYNCTVSAITGSFTSASADAKYQVNQNNRIKIASNITITTVGTGAGTQFTVPFTSARITTGGTRETTVVGFQCSLTVGAGIATCTIQKYDNANIAGSGYTFPCNIDYEI